MLPSSSTTPTETALVISETLTVMTLPSRSPHNVESKDSTKESESDTEEKESVSENDLEISGEQSHTVEVSGNRSLTQTVHPRVLYHQGPKCRSKRPRSH